jgi:protein TonB
MFSGLEVADVRHGRRWIALASFVLQGIVVSAAVVLPLLNPMNLPESLLRHSLLTPISFGDTGVRVRQQQTDHNPPALAPIIVAPNVFNFHKGGGHDPATTNPGPPGPPNIDSSLGPGSPFGPSNIFSTANVQPILKPAPIPPKPVSVMMEGNLIHRVEPPYPMIAKQIRLQGTVVLRAIVGADGTIEQIQVISGHPILVQAAREAVNQWKYQPYFLNGLAIPVETEVTVKFVLNQ